MSRNTANKDISELLERIKKGEENAIEQLLSEYAPLIEAKTAEYGSILEEDDIRQLCAIGLFEAAQSFSEERSRGKVTFGLYAKLCVRNRILSEIRKLGPKAEQMEEYTAIEDRSLEEEVIRRQELASSVAKARKKLTPYEDKVLRLYLKSGSYDKVASMLGKTRKSVDNAMSRIRSKFRDQL